MTTTNCRDCQRFRKHIEALVDRNAELELRLEGARQRERRAAAAEEKDSDQSGRNPEAGHDVGDRPQV
jgi:regulator of replication initiation timing